MTFFIPDTTQQPIPYISLLERYLVSRGVQAQYGVHPCVVKEYGDVPFYQGIVTLRSSTHLLQPYKSSNCYLTIGQAHEEAAKIAYFSLMERYHSAIPDQAGTIESTMPSHSAAVSSVVQDTLGSASKSMSFRNNFMKYVYVHIFLTGFDSSEDGSRAISNVSSVDHSYPSGGVINPHSSQLSNGAAVSASAVVQPKVSTSTSKLVGPCLFKSSTKFSLSLCLSPAFFLFPRATTSYNGTDRKMVDSFKYKINIKIHTKESL